MTRQQSKETQGERMNASWIGSVLCGLMIACLPALAMAGEEENAMLKAREVKLLAAYAKQRDTQVFNEQNLRRKHLLRVARELCQVAELTEDEAARLDKAVTEAVEHSLVDFRKQLDQYYKSMVALRLGKARPRVRVHALRGATIAEKDKVWVKAVQEVLTDQQRADYASATAQRAVFRRQAIVRRVIAEIDARVLLTQEQREQLVPLVDAAFAKKNVRLIEAAFVKTMNSHARPFLLDVDDKQLEGILSESQQDRWLTIMRGKTPTPRGGH